MHAVVDSNVFIGAYFTRDEHHSSALEMLTQFQDGQKLLNDLLFSEVATVLLQKTKNLYLVTQILQFLLSKKDKTVQVERCDAQLFKETLKIFSSQSSTKLSFADCSVIAQARLHQVSQIISFDKKLRKAFWDEFEFFPRYLP